MFRSIESSLRANGSARTRGPMTGSAKQSMTPQAETWIASRNDESRELHHFPRMQLRDRPCVVADRAQHFIGVRADRRCHGGKLAAAMGEAETAAGKAQPAIGRIDLLDRAARGDLRMIDHLLDLPDRGAGRARRIQNLLPLARALLRKRLLDDGPQRRLVLLAREPVGKA